MIGVSDEEWEGESPEELEASMDEEFDELGFAMPAKGTKAGDAAREYAQWFKPKADRRRQRFEARRQQLGEPGAWEALPKGKLKALLRKGVPPEYRPEVWWSTLGCEARRQRSASQYRELVDQPLREKTKEEIERDLQRTFPNQRGLRAMAGQAQLRNVLRAFASHAPRVQYCQGLNFIAALFLIVFLDEERAFWAMVCAMERLDVEGYYVEGMTLLRADMSVLAGVLAQKCPKVARVFRENEILLISICSEWYITWFAKCLPVPTLLRVWDTLFFEGFKVLFRIALGIFRCVEPEVLRCRSFEAVMESANRWPRSLVAHNALLKASFGDVRAFRRRDLLRARCTEVCRVEEEDEARQRRILEVRQQAQRAAAERAEQRQAAAAESAVPLAPAAHA